MYDTKKARAYYLANRDAILAKARERNKKVDFKTPEYREKCRNVYACKRDAIVENILTAEACDTCGEEVPIFYYCNMNRKGPVKWATACSVDCFKELIQYGFIPPNGMLRRIRKLREEQENV